VSEQSSSIWHYRLRVACVEDDNTVDMCRVPSPVDFDSFWPKDCSIPDEKKRALFWQFRRAIGCDQFTFVLAQVLKALCDTGVPLMHQDRPVVDIQVLNSNEFDVSDLLAAQGDDAPLKVRDPVTGVTVPFIATHETMDRLFRDGRRGVL